MADFPSYSDIVKKVDAKSGLGKKAQKIAKQLEDSRKSVTKNVADNLPGHVKLLNSSLKDLNGLKKDKDADEDDLEIVDELISQVESDVKMLSDKPSFEATPA